MTSTQSSSGGGIIAVTIVIAMILMILPLPESLRLFRPEFVLLVLMYWVMALPRKVSVGYAWLVGILVDIMMGSYLGVTAFSYALVIYLTARFHLQLRQFPVWQQALIILSLVLIVHIVAVLVSPQIVNWYLWLPAISSMIVWPLNYALLRSVRRSFHIS
ncbi:rod shape-determining protein MreD [Methylophaga sp. 41_12_T18]|nr:rod shape-determining protein MreD [Methylophaga sp. 41_12_T18]